MPAAAFTAAPTSVLDAAGAPRFGAYAGGLEHVEVGPVAGTGLGGFLRRLASLKRWHHAFVATDELVLTLAVVDAGYAASGFVFAVERAGGAVLLDRTYLAPAPAAWVNDCPGAGARATLFTPTATLRLERRSDRYQLVAELGRRGRLEAVLDASAAPAPFTLVARVPGGDVHVTQKSGALPAAGELRCGSRRFSLGGGFGGLDYTQGLLARRTRWRWAYATGRAAGGEPLALNLADGIDDEAGPDEDVLFLGEGPRPLPRCTFEHDPERPLEPWRLQGGDGALDLRFTPLAVHREDRNLALVRARFVQVAGIFDGHLPGPAGAVPVAGLPGVCEDQELRW